MLVIATSISGSGRKEYLKNLEEYAKKLGKKVKVYHVGRMLFEHAKKVGVHLTPENVLNANPSVISAIRGAVFENILANLPKDRKENDVVIISIHSIFFWKKRFMRAYDRFYLNKLNPDMFVALFNRATDILKVLNSRKQWKPQKLSLHEILLWQNVEVEMTASWAEIDRKPFYVVSVLQPTNTLYRLIFEPWVEPVYVCMPITHLKKKSDQEKVERFVKELEKYFVVFNPLKLDIILGKKFDLASYHHTVNQDLYWLIKQSKKIIAYFPIVVASPGVINELREAHETNKDVWLIFPSKTKSPFLVYFSSQIFESTNEFFKFLKKYSREKKKK